jgi:hypothetical protein
MADTPQAPLAPGASPGAFDAPSTSGTPGSRPGPSLVQPAVQDARHYAYEVVYREQLAAMDLRPALMYRVHEGDGTPVPQALIFLARQFSLMGPDGWNLAQTDAQRRDLIQNAILLHRTKGTPGGVEDALVRSGFPSARVQERVREVEAGPAARFDGQFAFDGEINYDARTVAASRAWATFRVTLDLVDYDRARLSLADLRAVIESYKRAVCHLTDISFRADAPVEQVAVADFTAVDLAAPLGDYWWAGLRYDGTARAVGGAVVRYDGARAFNGSATFDGLAVLEGSPIYRYGAGPYPEALATDAELTLADRHALPARYDGAGRYDGTARFDGRLPAFRDSGVALIVLRDPPPEPTHLAVTATLSGALPTDAWTATLGGLTPSAAYRNGA